MLLKHSGYSVDSQKELHCQTERDSKYVPPEMSQFLFLNVTN